MEFKSISILVPVYNEEATVKVVLEKLRTTNLIGDIVKEVIVINDASKDNTEFEVKSYINENKEFDIQYIKHESNRGKGAAIRTGIALAKGDFIIIQDADLEYDPSEINLLLKPILDGYADVVYGSRFIGGSPHRVLFFFHSIGNHFLTFLSNIFTNINLTDMETCYKLFRSEILKNIDLKENRFGFEPEVTAKVSKVRGIKIFEVGISYYGRTYDEGKKINWRDGFRALYCIIRYNLFK